MFFCVPILLLLAFLYWCLHGPVDFFLWFAVAFLPLFGYGTYVALTTRFDNAVTERNLDVPASMENVCNAVVAAIVMNHWRLVDANREQGRFVVRIGMTFQTWGQVLTFSVSKISDISTRVHMCCDAIAQRVDYGKNDAVVSKFQDQLETILR